VALEELDPEIVFHLAEPAENRRMIDAKPLGGTGKAMGFGDDLHQPEIVPVEMLLFGHRFAFAQERSCKSNTGFAAGKAYPLLRPTTAGDALPVQGNTRPEGSRPAFHFNRSEFT
jgi:hypothetical protein